VRDAVVADDESPNCHIDQQGNHGKLRRSVEDIDQEDERNHSNAHHGETYCQRSNHAGSLAKRPIGDEDQGAEDKASSESRRRHPLNPLCRGALRIVNARRAAARNPVETTIVPAVSETISTNTPAIGSSVGIGQGMSRP